jgi:hypothetical protein
VQAEETKTEETDKSNKRIGLLNLKDSEFAKLFYINFGISDA